MRKWLVIIGLVAIAVGLRASDAVEPPSVSYTSIRDEAISALSGVYYRSTSLLLTNCVCYSDAVGVVTQGLTDVTIDISVGNTSTNVDYVANTYDIKADGVTNAFWVTITVPNFVTGTINIQTKLTDVWTNSYIYPWKTLAHKESM